ncbi:ABC transporter ATP-binding protein [Anaerocolumna xylanovorans]|uniref:NitT/TauT family transport system ATP-binding protein n=1 Tax=Anaerocolumna xylanovorans DSM 12503 TaxID=1121345 RepID=A0A1M7YJQ4_9FIRM|nr:ATP-binding cassette domain-containing protein [Anaerocolumna xylanovorans]SHO52854.1 NitT/TauT family transport system ATP-binding protein [Anaerocolumna xylanovorans DSM 12503]
MLIINDLSIHYKSKQGDNPVICHLSFQLQEGESLAILGPSGCGKSTLINALAGSLAAESGTMEFAARDQGYPLSPKQHKIGLIPQNCGLLPWKTVRENCLLPLKIRKEYHKNKHTQELNRLSKALNIQDILNKYPNELSGGQLQRSAIARAFLLEPDLLLMDEPFSALDEITRAEARELFLRVWKYQKPTTILVTHSIEEALYLGNILSVMDAQGGNIKYQKNNPYFGQLYPDHADYLTAKQILRQQLVTKEEGMDTFE